MLGKAKVIHLERVFTDSVSAFPQTDRAKAGCNCHALTDVRGVPLAVKTTLANTPDGEVALRLIVAMPPIRGPKGGPRTNQNT